MKILLDSVILIDHFNNISQATEYLRFIKKEAAISVITRLEVLTGASNIEREMYVRFLNTFPCLIIDAKIADFIAKLRQQYKWKTPDAIQAGLAQYHHLMLATRNTKDFSPEKHDFVVIPYVLVNDQK